jgi:uncharacterized protein DUF4435
VSFVDDLRNARLGPTTVRHEFLTNYNHTRLQSHAFVEGWEDRPFYRTTISRFCGRNRDLFFYRCGNKQRVYDIFADLTAGTSQPKGILFFVDKNSSDLLGERWPQDERIFVTDVYSIENYFVSADAVRAIFSDLIQLRNLAVDFGPVIHQFRQELERVHRRLRPVMAWLVAARRLGLRPNVNNLVLDDVCFVSEACSLVVGKGRARTLEKKTGVPVYGVSLWKTLAVARELRRLNNPKDYVRGKFELQFLVRFVKQVTARLRTLAKESSGRVVVHVPIEDSSAIEVLAARIETPDSLRNFLVRHFPEGLRIV